MQNRAQEQSEHNIRQLVAQGYTLERAKQIDAESRKKSESKGQYGALKQY
ncbi:hypothetical protein bcgnr5406_61390 [Bacillus cereus]